MEYKAEEVLKPVGKIFGALKLPHRKNTAEIETVKLPLPKVVTIPLKQNIGAECEPLVKAGDKVLVGTKIGDSDKPFSVPVHSSVSGTVKEIIEIFGVAGDTTRAVVIESDGEMAEEDFTPPVINTAEDLVKAARDSGLVGLGGAGFPTHIKLAPAANDSIDTLIVNGAECEPYITSDYRTCIEHFNDVIDGVYLLKEKLGLKKVVIAVEDNKPEAIKKLYEIATDKRDEDNTVRIMRLTSRYPQGAEKVLVYTTTKRKSPFGKLPADVGCLVMNITSIAVLNKYVRTGKPLVAKLLTVDGDAVRQPKNVLVPIGTPISDVLDFCSTEEAVSKILYGGPMMGVAVTSDSAVITKQNNAVLAFKGDNAVSTTPCIRCGKCAAACPMSLTPAAVETAVNLNLNQKLAKLNVNYCIECGSCSFTCPAGRPLTQTMRTAKGILRREKNAK